MELIRKLEFSDLEQMLSLRIEIQNYDSKYMDSKSIILNQKQLEEKTKEYLKNNLNNTLYMFGCFIDKKLIANCGFYIDKHFPTYKNPNGITGYICNVFTLKEYRNKGYQKKVFETCFKYAKEMGITSFRLDSINENAISMYKSFGFINNNHIYSLDIII